MRIITGFEAISQQQNSHRASEFTNFLHKSDTESLISEFILIWRQ